jgi:hypothetical protein
MPVRLVTACLQFRSKHKTQNRGVCKASRRQLGADLRNPTLTMIIRQSAHSRDGSAEDPSCGLKNPLPVPGIVWEELVRKLKTLRGGPRASST